LIALSNPFATKVDLLKWRFLLAVLPVNKWLLLALKRFILPDFVTRILFLTLLFVFSFGIVIPFLPASRPAQGV
jgi:hypothetical protein